MGFLGDLADSFTGKGAEKQLKNQRDALTSGRDAANSQYTSAEGQAHGAMAPYTQGGQQFYDTYKNALGMGGADAQKQANDGYFNNPAMQESRRLSLIRAQRGANAGGNYSGPDGGRSGVGALADSRVNYQNYQGYLDRLQGGAQAGQAAAGADAGISQWGGAGRAGADMGAANGIANSYGESAKNANTLAQNTIGLGSLAVSAYTGVPMGRPANSYGQPSVDPSTGKAPANDGFFNRLGNNISSYFG